MKKTTIAILLIVFCGNLFLFEIAESNEHDVYQAQERLKELGYDPGSIDGIWGKKTTSAIKRFQQDNGLPVTGKLDKQTRAELIIRKPPSQRSFIEAIKRDDIITAKALIAAGVDVNTSDKSGDTPLHIAAVRGYQELAALLIAEGANVNARNERELTPLHAAAWGDHIEIVELLVAKGSDINARGEHGTTPLHVSALSGSDQTMAFLINSGADINARNKDGATPLHAASLTGQKEAVKLLINKGADVKAKNKEGMTALQMASQKGHQSIVTLLEQHVNP
jgi:ankyrin repeat protein